MQTYAIGDIHGHLDKLRAAHALIAADRARHGTDAPVVHVGDLVDRGPDCRGVIEYLRAGIMAGQDWLVLKGNHDRIFAGFFADPDYRDPGLRHDLHWFDPRLGGAATLASYGVDATLDGDIRAIHSEMVAAVPQSHVDFVNARPAYHLRGQTLFVHAGIRPGVDLHEQTEDDLVWIRAGFLDDPRDHGALVVHGHTAIDRATHYGNRLNIDSGAAYGGPLSAVLIDGCEVWLLTDQGREAIAFAPLAA